MHFVKE